MTSFSISIIDVMQVTKTRLFPMVPTNCINKMMHTLVQYLQINNEKRVLLRGDCTYDLIVWTHSPVPEKRLNWIPMRTISKKQNSKDYLIIVQPSGYLIKQMFNS